VEAKRQARKQREQDAAAAAAAAKRPVGRPNGGGKKPGPAPQQLVWVRTVVGHDVQKSFLPFFAALLCQPGAPASRDIALDISQSGGRAGGRAGAGGWRALGCTFGSIFVHVLGRGAEASQ
jgi:hypothetical protein